MRSETCFPQISTTGRSSGILVYLRPKKNQPVFLLTLPTQGRIQDFKLGGAHLIFGVFRVKNHDFTPKNHIFSNFRGGMHRVHPPPLPLDPPLQHLFLVHMPEFLLPFHRKQIRGK